MTNVSYRWAWVYLASILLLNYAFGVLPLVKLPWGDVWPIASLLVGFIFIIRDFAQRDIGHGVLAFMGAGAVLSFLLADPYVALASLVAFAVSEVVDWGFYTLGGPYATLKQKVIVSSIFSTPIDSAVFLLMIGHFSWSAVAIMTLSKMLGLLVVWRMK